MDSKEQREITKVYVSAFLETTLLGNNRYEKLFHNYQYGLQWLPETLSFSRYQNGMFKPMDNFNASSDKSVLKNGIRAEAEEFTLWEIEKAKDRRGNNKGNSGTVLQWDRKASYSIFLSDSYINRLAQGPDSFILSIANMARDLDTEISLSPQVEVEFKNKIGESIQVPLDEYMPVPAEIKVQYTKIPWFDKTMKGDKYQEEQEPVFHMYEIKLDRIKSLNYNMSFENISEIILHFSNGPGKVMIDDIGYISYPATLKP